MTSFSGELVLVLLDDKDHPATRAGRSLWGVQHELTYETKAANLITIPAGFVTDLASIPRVVWSFYPPDGPWAKAAVVHDFLYFTRGSGMWHGRIGVNRPKPYSRKEADDILREAMEDRGVGEWERFVIWAAVRLGGSGGWGR